MKLYSYFRSSAAYRVRIALGLKNLPFDIVPVHLVKCGGEQKLPDYTAINPQQLVPTFATNNGEILTQSMAILEFLEESYPQTPLLPTDKLARAKVRALCQIIASDIHPLNNLRVLKYLKNTLEVSEIQKDAWYQHWIAEGFEAIEKMLPDRFSENGNFCYGDTPTFADCCLIPQVYNALRFDCDMTNYPKIMQIYTHCNTLPAFISASPEQQIDFHST